MKIEKNNHLNHFFYKFINEQRIENRVKIEMIITKN